MAGIQSLMQAPQGQGQMPGQAPQQPMPGMMPQQGPSGPGIAPNPFAGEKLDKLLYLYRNPQLIPEGETYRVITALSEAVKGAQRAQQMAGQQAIAQNAQMQQQPPVAEGLAQQAESLLRGRQQAPVMAAHGGIMHGYAGGGAVAFTNGGAAMDPYALYEAARKYGIDLPLYDQDKRAAAIERVKSMIEFDKQRKSFGDIPTDTSKLFPFGPPESPMMPVPEIQVRPSAPAGTGIAGARRPPAGNKPSAMSQGLGSFVEQTGTPAPDTLSDIEAKRIADINALKGILQQQGTVDPELMKLREAAYKSSQDIAARRERDRQAALEAAQKQYEDPTDFLLAMAGSAGGKTFGEVLGGAAKGAGSARTAKRTELQQAQKIAREEQNAIDTLNQALADKRVADMTGDVNQRREADRKVAEAQLDVTKFRLETQKERAAEADRAEQRKIAREQIANQLKVAQIGAAAKEGAVGLAEQRLALQAMRADPNYAAIVKELTEAKKMAGVSSSPTLQARLRAAEKAARDLATAYGVTPGMMGMGGAGAPAPEGKVVDFNAIGKK